MRKWNGWSESCKELQNKQQHKVNSVMMRNDKIDVQVVIKLSNISNEKYTYLQGIKA